MIWCQHDTGSMYGCEPACDRSATHVVTYWNGSLGPFHAHVCATHVPVTEARAHPGHVSTVAIVAPRYGWVTVAPGKLRPAYVPGTDPVTGECDAPAGAVWYSPAGAGGWRDAPPDIAGTFVLQYVSGAWRPFTVPAGFEVIP